MLFRMDKPKVDINTETLKLRINVVECLLRNRFTWEEIFKAAGFSEAWYHFTKKVLKEREAKS